MKLRPMLSALLLFSGAPTTTLAEAYPGYCNRLLPAAGYTFVGPATISNTGLVTFSSSAEAWTLAQPKENPDTWLQVNQIRAHAIEIQIAQKDGVSYLIGQIDVRTKEPFCARIALE